MYFTRVKLGALTSKVSSYKYRSWEVEMKGSLDFFDSLGIIGISCVKGLQILRILPQSNIFFDWISDKFRFSFDSLYENRNVRILCKREEVSLLESLTLLSTRIFSVRTLSFFFGKTLDVIDSILVKNFSIFFKNVSYVSDSLFNNSLVNIDERVVMYINFIETCNFKNFINWGIDLRIEFPVLEAFFMQKGRFELLFSLGSITGMSLNIGVNLLNHFVSFFNGCTYFLKKILVNSSLFIGGVGIFGRTLYLNYLQGWISLFFIKVSNIFKNRLLKFITLMSYMSDVNIVEVGLVSKNIGGYVGKRELVFALNSSDLNVDGIASLVSFSTYVSVSQIYFLNYPLVAETERSLLSYNLQGILNCSEKVVKNKFVGFTVWSYFKTFINYIKYKNFTTISLLETASFCLNSFIKLKNFITLNRVFVERISKKQLLETILFNYFIDIVLQNNSKNYFYTHPNLFNSPTILLADSRLFRKNAGFFK